MDSIHKINRFFSFLDHLQLVVYKKNKNCWVIKFSIKAYGMDLLINIVVCVKKIVIKGIKEKYLK